MLSLYAPSINRSVVRVDSLYDILILGCGASSVGEDLMSAITDLLQDSGVDVDEVKFVMSPAGYKGRWDGMLPVVVACFSQPSTDELDLIQNLSKQRVPIIPIANVGERFEDFPVEVRHLNGAKICGGDDRYVSVSTAILEAVGLLREQRRLFISYRRTESRSVAVQLHDILSGRGFSVFLDTHAIRPGKVFQDELWHSLCDSDVVVMLDTPGYFDSKWTREEFGRAQAFGIHLLRLVWPGHSPEMQADLSETIRLSEEDLAKDLLSESLLDEVLGLVERLRARGIADRYLALTGKLKTEVQTVDATVIGAGAYRAISVKLSDDSISWIYPVVGVPTAPLMNSIASRAMSAKHDGPFLVYDHVGISEPWLEHLEWLDRHIPEVDFMRVSEASAKLTGRIK